MRELRFALIFGDVINGQSHKIERDRFNAILFELEEDFRLGLNLVARVFDRQAQPVMNGVERRVARVIVGGGERRSWRAQQQGENESGKSFHYDRSFPQLRAITIACTTRGGSPTVREGVDLCPPSRSGYRHAPPNRSRSLFRLHHQPARRRLL